MNLHWAYETYTKERELWPKIFERVCETKAQIDALSQIFSDYDLDRGSWVLDLCCGNGRHAIALGREGYHVLGIDFSRPLITMAKENLEKKENSGKVEFIIGDARCIPLNRKPMFNAVISMTNSLAIFPEDVNENILSQVKELMVPNGVLIFDVYNKDFVIQRFKTREQIFTKDEYKVRQLGTIDLKESKLKATWEIYKKEKDKSDFRYTNTVNFNFHLYSIDDLICLVKAAGWRYEQAYGGFDLQRITENSKRIVVVASIK